MQSAVTCSFKHGSRVSSLVVLCLCFHITKFCPEMLPVSSEQSYYEERGWHIAKHLKWVNTKYLIL